MKSFIHTNGQYFEFEDDADSKYWDKKELTAVPNRPSEYHSWDGRQWIEDTAKKNAFVHRQNNVDIFLSLNEIDFKSIRALREGNVALVEDYNAQAEALRLQIIK